MEVLHTFYKELEQEFNAIIRYWTTYGIDIKNGGFLGERDRYNSRIPNANKGIILNARLLWSFSAMACHIRNEALDTYVERAYDYLRNYFKDDRYGGVYWEVDAKGIPVDKKKQTYAQAFARAANMVVPHLIEGVAPGPGTNALDLCCGHGNVTAGLVHTGANVTGVDFSDY